MRFPATRSIVGARSKDVDNPMVKDPDVVSHISLSSSDSGAASISDTDNATDNLDKEKLEMQERMKIDSRRVRIWRVNVAISLCVVGCLVT
jgi:hypothetical protein